jgi:AcrR family transcriptional regulator
MTEVAMETLDRYQVRSQKTLAHILKGAEELFVRDGFESAQMDEIAARAERSKGALYVHFKSKEDLFLALIEHRIKMYKERYANQMRHATTPQKQLEAHRDFYDALAQDRNYHVLTLEFKLFALRHPEWKDRYRKAFESLKQPVGEADFQQMFGSRSRSERADLRAFVLALGPIANSLVLEGYFEPDDLSDKAIRKILRRIIDAFLPAS